MTDTFGTAVCRVTMTRRPFGSVRSTRGARRNGRSGPTAGRVASSPPGFAACANAGDASARPSTRSRGTAPEHPAPAHPAPGT